MVEIREHQKQLRSHICGGKMICIVYALQDLAMIALRILIALASETSAERAFSKLGIAINKLQTSTGERLANSRMAFTNS